MGFFGKIKGFVNKVKENSNNRLGEKLKQQDALKQKLGDKFKFLKKIFTFQTKVIKKSNKLEKKIKSFLGIKPKIRPKKTPIDKVTGKKKGPRSVTVKNNLPEIKRQRKKRQGIRDGGYKPGPRNEDSDDRNQILDLVRKKAEFIAVVKDDVREMLAGKSSAIVEVDELVKDINLNSVNFPRSIDELKKQNDILDNILISLGVEPDLFLESMADFRNMPKDEYYNLIKQISFNTYMDNWKNKFFASDDIFADGVALDDEGRNNLWMEIEMSKSQAWFDTYKANRIDNGDE